MRRQIVAGNWKMNTTPAQGVELLNGVAAIKSEAKSSVELIACVPFTHICAVSKAAQGTGIEVAAQNCADQAKGAYTGEVSAEMLASMGVNYVILGHSERREYYHENSEILNKKMALVYANAMTPIYCIGEKKEEREANKQNEVCYAQISEVVFNLTAEQFAKLIIAYEPVWAIGTGLTATAEQAQDIHSYIRSVLAEKFGKEAADKTPILYGGSCKPSNAAEIFGKADVDGGLIGGASLVASDFVGIAKAF